MKVFFLEIENKTDILALAAFLISLATIMTNIFLMIKGPEIYMVKPDQVAITFSQQKKSSEKYVKLVADNYFFNKASPGYDDVISKMNVSMAFGSEVIDLRWQYFAITDTDGSNVFERDRKPVKPILVKARQSDGAEIHYLPYTIRNSQKYKNYMTWEKFKEIIQKEKVTIIHVTFRYETFSNAKGEVNCDIEVSESFLANILDIEKNRADVACF